MAYPIIILEIRTTVLVTFQLWNKYIHTRYIHTQVIHKQRQQPVPSGMNFTSYKANKTNSITNTYMEKIVVNAFLFCI